MPEYAERGELSANEPQFYGDLIAAYHNAKVRFADRDQRHEWVALAREGEVEKLMPGFFPKNFPKSIVANVVDLAARDLGELLGEMPEIHARAANPHNKESIKRAEKRTKIIVDIASRSNLQLANYSACDRFVSFAGYPLVVEPDILEQRVRIRPANPIGSYWDLDMYGNTVRFWESWMEPVASLTAKFPNLKWSIKYGRKPMSLPDLSWVAEQDNELVEVVRYYDAHKICLFLPSKDGLTLLQSPNPTPGHVPVYVAELPNWRPGQKGSTGAYDQALWAQVARARMALFTLEAADKAINAPIKMPKDVTQFNYGPNAKIQTDSPSPNAVERVKLDLPNGVLAENELLRAETRTGARYPEGRSGNIDASIVTGQGVRELLGTIDSQVKTYQDLIAWTQSRAFGHALRLDETLWPELEKDIHGEMDGAEFVESYKPSRDIGGNYGVKVSYGLAYGMDHQRGLIFALQLRGDREIPRSVVREQFARFAKRSPEQLAQQVDTEEAEDALKAGIGQWVASWPALAQQGQDPSRMLSQLARYNKNRLKGKDNVTALLEALEPTKEELAAQQQQAQQLAATDPMAAAAQELGIQEAPGPAGAVPASPQGQAQGGLQMLMANLTQSGRAESSAGISRMLPT